MRSTPPRSGCPLVSLLVLAALGLSLSGCSENGTEGEVAATDGTRRVINVSIHPLQVQRFTDIIRLTGTVIADRSVTVAAQEGGTVTEIVVDKGQRVRTGELLLRLDDELLRAQRDEARAQMSLTRQLWERTRRLYEEDDVGTENEYLQARFNAEQAQARLTLIEARLARTRIRAPFDGILDARQVEVGSVVLPGTPVATVIDLTPLKVSAGVPERYAADVAVGARAAVIFDAVADTGTAVVAFVGATIHPANRTFPVELSLAGPTGSIKPEMVADVILERRVLEEVIVVPRQALVRTEDGFVAFVARGSGGEDATAEVRPVRLGPAANDEVVVISGLRAGERLVVLGQTQIADGDHLRIVSQR